MKKNSQPIKVTIPFHKDTKFTVEEVAAELRKSTATIYDLIKKRKLEAYRIGRNFVITGSQLDDFAERRRLKRI